MIAAVLPGRAPEGPDRLDAHRPGDLVQGAVSSPPGLGLAALEVLEEPVDRLAGAGPEHDAREPHLLLAAHGRRKEILDDRVRPPPERPLFGARPGRGGRLRSGLMPDPMRSYQHPLDAGFPARTAGTAHSPTCTRLAKDAPSTSQDGSPATGAVSMADACRAAATARAATATARAATATARAAAVADRAAAVTARAAAATARAAAVTARAAAVTARAALLADRRRPRRVGGHRLRRSGARGAALRRGDAGPTRWRDLRRRSARAGRLDRPDRMDVSRDTAPGARPSRWRPRCSR